MRISTSRAASLTFMFCVVLATGNIAVANPEVAQVKEQSGFRFELMNCMLAGKDVKCNVRVTSQKRDQNLQVTLASNIYDDAGNVYTASKVQIANQESTRQYLTRLLVAGIPTPVALHFLNVSTDARAIALFDLKCAGFNVQFRDIPIGQ